MISLSLPFDSDLESLILDHLILTSPPPLNPAWITHIPHLSAPAPPNSTPATRQSHYSHNCIVHNTALLTTHRHLTQNLNIASSFLPTSPQIPIRTYTPHTLNPTLPQIIYYHGGGLSVDNLDSEDPTCRLLALSLNTNAVSVDYRLLPVHNADDAVADALAAFSYLCDVNPGRKFVLVGSSSGGQLAATVALEHLREIGERGEERGGDGKGECRIVGVALRCPVTCDATEGGESVLSEWRERGLHTSMRPDFCTGILASLAVMHANRVRKHKMPLEMLSEFSSPNSKFQADVGTSEHVEDVEDGNREEKDRMRQIRWFIQLCTNDIYYSDAVCLGIGPGDSGAEVKIRVEEGWPHTFWLKGGSLMEARRAGGGALVREAGWILGNEGDRKDEWVGWGDLSED